MIIQTAPAGQPRLAVNRVHPGGRGEMTFEHVPAAPTVWETFRLVSG